MKYQTAGTAGGCVIDARASERPSFTEYHLTAISSGSPAEVFAAVAAEMAAKKIQPIQEKLYGKSWFRQEALRLREQAWQKHGLDVGVPVTWIQGTPTGDGDFVGMQVWGIASRDGGACVTTIENAATGRGRCWTGKGFRMVYLPSVRGTDPGGALASGRTAQAERMFANAGEGLKAHGLKYRNVARTWIYLARLLDWYGELNRVRTAHYQPEGVGVEGGVAFPASTGIQGRSGDEECLMDVLALDPGPSGGARATPIQRSPRQDSSFNYGSSFSRGMTLEIEGGRTVHISGTASINTAGATVHVGDAECQSLETLMSIAAILEEQGGGLRNIVQSTLFCKDRSACEAWTRVTRLLQVPAFPKVCVLADVCRPDLLVEMEAVAVI